MEASKDLDPKPVQLLGKEAFEAWGSLHYL